MRGKKKKVEKENAPVLILRTDTSAQLGCVCLHFSESLHEIKVRVVLMKLCTVCDEKPRTAADAL